MALNSMYCVDVPLHAASGLFMFTLPPKRGTTRKQKLIKKGQLGWCSLVIRLTTGAGWIVFQEWWTHLWLNEGFASWIEYLCVDHCFPEYDIWTQFATSDYTCALELDALKNSHPIEVFHA